MKAYEIIKALEEGKKIRSLDGVDKGKEYSIEEIAGSDVLFYILAAPSSYEVLKEKKKIKLYKYTYETRHMDSTSLSEFYIESRWTNMSSDYYRDVFLNSFANLVKEEEKEIEIDDE